MRSGQRGAAATAEVQRVLALLPALSAEDDLVRRGQGGAEGRRGGRDGGDRRPGHRDDHG